MVFFFSNQAWNDRPLRPDRLRPEALDVPSPPVQSPRQHRTHLVQHKVPRRRTRPAANDPEAGPLDPLAEVVRVQHQPEQPVLRDPVHLVHLLLLHLPPSCLAAAPLALFLLPLRFFFQLPPPLRAGRGTPDLAQLVVVIDVPEEATEEDDHAECYPRGCSGPVLRGGRAVAG